MKPDVNFESVNGKRVFRILTEPEDINKKIVIMSHGFRGTSIGPARTFVDFERLLLKEGFSVLRFDQPCGGNSGGEFLDSSFNDWIATTSYFTERFLGQGYKVALMGQSMGATTTMIAAGLEKFKNKIPCIILWVPDAKSGVTVEADKVYEESGQRYRGKFWLEAKEANFFDALENYPGGIHLVYGENDKYVSEELRKQTIEAVKSKNQPYMILSGQNHSSWDHDEARKVYEEEISFLNNYF